ncbi:hypothetical protein ACPPVT_18705 [Angustibacter sp. McL0619]|uniref:hypothetical protein n=1 Tax=Angustibacter sp. McL0619 TaxID=3415676 RepID=UPI003CE883A9
MKNKRTFGVAIGALTAGIVLVPVAASASNGQAWLLGRANAETTATTVTNSAGTPLSLKAKSGYAPLAVNSTKTVTNLSADRLDGLDSTSLAKTSGRTGTIVHDGDYDALGAKCPVGTVFVSGGGYAKYGAGIRYSGPDWNADTGAIIPNSWIVLDESDYPGVSNVTCYSPSGAAIPGAATTLDQLSSGGANVSESTSGPSWPSARVIAKAESFQAAQVQPKR